MNTIRILSAFGVLLAFVVIALGAWTRLADAGLVGQTGLAAMVLLHFQQQRPK